MANLTGQQICTTYNRLLQIDGGQLQDGYGNAVTSLNVTASYLDVTGSGVLVNWFGSQLQLTASSAVGSAGVVVSDTAPSGSSQGQLWWDTTDANMYMYYQYVDTGVSQSAWVPAMSLSIQSLTSVTSSYSLTSSYYIMEDFIAKEFVDDTAAAAGGIPLGGIYRSGNIVTVRIS